MVSPCQESQKAPCELDPCLPFWLYLWTSLPWTSESHKEPLAVGHGHLVFSILAGFVSPAPSAWNNPHPSLALAGQVESIPVSPACIGTLPLPILPLIPPSCTQVTSFLVCHLYARSSRQGSCLVSSQPTTFRNIIRQSTLLDWATEKINE